MAKWLPLSRVDDDDDNFSDKSFFLNCGVFDECAADMLLISIVLETEYDNDGVFASDNNATWGILCELELSCIFW